MNEGSEQRLRRIRIQDQMAPIQSQLESIIIELNELTGKSGAYQPKGPEIQDDLVNSLTRLYDELMEIENDLDRSTRNKSLDLSTFRSVVNFSKQIDELKKRINLLRRMLNARRSREAEANLSTEIDKFVKSIEVDSSSYTDAVITAPTMAGGSLILSIGALLTVIKHWRDKRRS